MTPERWQQITAIFHAALAREPSVREAFLADACRTDVTLRSDVDAMLAGHEGAGQFGEVPLLTSVSELQPGSVPGIAPLAIGSCLGPYQILSALGAGGMGQVYKAVDPRLHRDVAIKVLPPVFTRDPDRLARFEREARVLAALNHPHIGAIYGLEETGGIRGLVLELVEGSTLADRLKDGPAPVADALSFGEQIAEALEAAHSKGIVHRDLKPANVKVTPEGRVKVLDFGLAKAIWGTEERHDSSQLRTMTGLESLAGHIVGTPPYMSPEQARGSAVDKRTDIWAFGCLLYELLTGKRAFQGVTMSDTIEAVLEREPDWSALPAKTPARIRELLRQCLQKEGNRRLPNIADARRTIKEAQRGWNRWRLVAVVVATLATLAVGAALLAGWFIQRPRGVTRAPIITRLTTDSGLTADPALSPDGKLLAYASDRASNGNLDIWIQQTAGGNPLRLTTNGADDLEPSFSPDSARIVFRSQRERGGVYVVPALGGLEQRVAALGHNPRFSPDGRWIAYWVGDASFYGRRFIFVIPAIGGQPHQIQPGFFFASHPVWSPDSRYLLFRGARDADAAQRGLFDWWVTPLDGGAAVETGAKALQVQSTLPATEPNQMHGGWGVNPNDWIGESVFFSAASGSAGLNASLWRVGISSRFHVEGPAQRLTSGTENVLQPSAAGAHIAFASITQNVNIWSLSVDPSTARVSGEPQRLTSSAATDSLPTTSADGRDIAFASNRTGNLHVWIKHLDTGAETALTSSRTNELPFLLSPDGSRLVYCVFRGLNPQGSEGCFIAPTAGGAARKFCEECPSSSIQDWFENGHKVLYKKGVSTDTQLILRDLDSGNETLLLQHPKYSVTAARFSRDERWMSFQVVIEATRRQIFVTPIRNGRAAGESEWIPITDGAGLDRNAVWSPDGDLLYFLSERDGFRCFWAQRLDHTSKRPVGEPFAAYHFHQTRRSLMPFQEVGAIGLSVTRDRITFGMAQTNGNIWLANFE